MIKNILTGALIAGSPFIFFAALVGVADTASAWGAIGLYASVGAITGGLWWKLNENYTLIDETGAHNG